MKVHLGCGRNIMPGWVNVDRSPLPGVDLVTELDDPNKIMLPWPDDSVDEYAIIHTLEHIRYPLPLMEELWRAAKPGATMTIACPYGSSDDADEDPTHVRRMFAGSWGYFGQPHFWRADYGYRGDWQPVRVELFMFPGLEGCTDGELQSMIRFQRNVVAEMAATLRCVKPAREPRADLQETYTVTPTRQSSA